MLHPPSVNGPPPAFGALLVLARRRRGYSQMKLALAANVSLRHLGFLELGRSRPSADMVLRLASALNLAPGEEDQLLVAAGFAPGTAGRAPPRRAGAPQENGADTWTACVFAAALRIQASGAPSEALRLASEAFARLGFEDLLVGCVPREAAGGAGVLFFEGAAPPRDGCARRRMGDLRAFTPVLRWAATHPTPFYGRQMIAARAREPGVARMAAAARDLGLEDALVLPWRMRPGEVYFVVLAVRRAASDPALALAARTLATALVEALDRLDAPRTPACERLIRRKGVVGILGRAGPGGPRPSVGAPSGGDEACARF